jgi:hypothetical protein
MKKIRNILILGALLFLIGGCDKDFVDINTNPYALSDIDPQLLFARAQRSYLGVWDSEGTVIQQFVNPFNDGATLAFNFNANIDNFQNASWEQYSNDGYEPSSNEGSVEAFVQILDILKGTTTQVNLQSMTRIWKAYVFMDLVDHYADVPYFNAGLAAINGDESFYPSYDNDETIYADLEKEITEALANLNPAGDYVSADLFYGSKAYYPISDAATQVAKWEKLGNSLLLRLGMRYSKIDAAKAASIVATAFNGGVMTSNTDNAFVVYDGTLYTNVRNDGLINNNPKFYYAAEPLVNQLKSTNDPRSKYMIASFADPNNPKGDPNPDYNVANQFGLPVGVLSADLTVAKGYRGTKGGGYNYSQLNVNVAASLKAPSLWVTYSETSLLLAEAAQRGWITGDAKQYYEEGIKADMTNYSLFLSATASSLPSVSETEQNDYLAQPGVAYDAAKALEQINTQYWIANFTNPCEAWANLRRSGYPALTRNSYNDNLLANGGDGFVHRFTYPDSEVSTNSLNYQAAVTAIGGTDDLVTRVFWDAK